MQAHKLAKRYGIDIECPIIHPDFPDRAWEWQSNLDVDDTANATRIHAEQIYHGQENVTLGHPLNPDTNCAIYTNEQIGLWIRHGQAEAHDHHEAQAGT